MLLVKKAISYYQNYLKNIFGQILLSVLVNLLLMAVMVRFFMNTGAAFLLLIFWYINLDLLKKYFNDIINGIIKEE